ncbi:ITIH2 inhibitor, partial [Amia calva]|nr:ITIH2 inhibitor [Amia calva]
AISGDGISLQSYKVEARITSHYAVTTIKSKVVNTAKHPQSIGFNVDVPKNAFITKFSMNVDGVTFVGVVKEKTVARRLYAQARSRGKAAGIVRTNSQNMETFKAELFVPASSKVEFELQYQGLMMRKLSVYEYVLNLQPGKLVPQFQVDVYIYEPMGIAYVEVPNILGEQFEGITKVTHSKNKAHVSFRPTLQQQRSCHKCTSTALSGLFIVKYDVVWENNGGNLQISDGHFVHFFAPSNLAPLPKNIVFVIDVSGSMWGLKMKQTVQAMQTILDDLSYNDFFSIIDFNHNVRCWSEELVPASSIQVAEAKKYIQAIQPNGGTNINEALLRAIYMLSKGLTYGYIDPRSVSMIILVSDGDPTVGEIKLSTIQKNVKRIMREEFSLFSLGIGFDVDYDFLERIAMENRGMAQRIYANQDASEQLRNFYTQVSSPLLRKIDIQFPDIAVSKVTQNIFDKYFNGSELVVAGKLNPGFPVLQGLITASSAWMEMTFNVDANVNELDEVLASQANVYSGFAKQLWAYITIKQLMADRALAPNAVKKRKITHEILNLALEHQFVTPMTAMLVESEDGTERVLADLPKDPKQACCTGKVHFITWTSFLADLQLGRKPILVTSIPPEGVPPRNPPWPVPTTMEAEAGPITLTVVNTVDNDPHFIIHLPKKNMDVCFNIDSEPGDILSLVSDSDSGVVVNGQLRAAKQPEKNKMKTYFGTIAIYYKPGHIKVKITTKHISIEDEQYTHFISWKETGNLTQNGVQITIKRDSHVTITLNEKVSFMVLLHRVWKKHPVNVDFLGIYTPHTNVYSPKVHGLIGQFAIEPEVQVYSLHDGLDPGKPEATMDVKGGKLAVTRGWQKDYRADKVHGSDVYCWFIHNSGKGFIDGNYKNYIVPQLDSFLQQDKFKSLWNTTS